MLKKLKNGGILALVLAAGMAVLQPASANAAERPNRDGYHDQIRRGGDWNRGHDIRDRRDWDRRPVVNRYYAPAPVYRYPVADPYYGYSNCPR